jgi:hypothetical protein
MIMSHARCHELIFVGLLSHFCTQSRAKKCIDISKQLTLREVENTELSDEIIDENFQLTQTFFAESAWEHVQTFSKYIKH